MAESNLSPPGSIAFLPVSEQRLPIRGGWSLAGEAKTHRLLSAAQGTASLRVGSERLSIRHGQFLWIEPAVPLAAEEDGVGELLLFSFQCQSAGTLPIPAPDSRDYRIVDGMEASEFSRTLKRMHDLLEQVDRPDLLQRMRTQARFQELMISVWQAVASPPASERHDSREAVDRAVAYLEAHYDEDVDMDRLIKEARIGKRYFNQLFRERTGASIVEFVTERRMLQAQRLLSQKGTTVQDVARTVGYRDEFYFNRKFKQSLGIAPGQYARISRRQEKLFATQYLGHLLALGVRPVGATSNIMSHAFLKGWTGGIASIEQPMEIEQIYDLRPDLIIGWEPSDEEELSNVAPVILLPYGQRTSIDQFLLIGDLLDRKKEARQWVDRYETKAMRLKRMLHGRVGSSETVSIIEVWGHGIVVYGNRWGRGGFNLYNALELNAPDPVRRHLIDGEPYHTITLEQLPDYAGDRIFLSVFEADGGRERALQMLSSAIWNQLPAVQRGLVYEVDIKGFGAGDPISLSRQMDIQVSLLMAGGRG